MCDFRVQRGSMISLFLFSLAICELTDQLDQMVSKGQQQLRFALISKNALEKHLPFRLKCGEIRVRMHGREV